MTETTPPALSHLPPPRWFKCLSGWGLRLLKPILPERWLHWLEHAAWFIVIGGMNTMLAYLIFVVFLNFAGLSRALALLVAYALGMLISYQSFGRLVFGRGQQQAGPRFVMSQVILYLANKVLLDLIVWASGFSDEFAQFLLIPLVAILSYILNRFFVFRR